MRKQLLAFTLIEICLAVAIGMMILAMAVPSVQGVFAERALKSSLERLDDLARAAQMLSVSERRTFVLNWENSGIALSPEQLRAEDSGKTWPRLEFEKDEVFEIDRPVALEKKPTLQWVFWRSGNCEPVIIHYKGAAGRWSVRYDALTARSGFYEQEIQ